MKIVLLKELCQIRHGGTPSKANPAFWRGSIPWVSPKDMKASALADATDHISEQAVANSATSLVPEGSILVVARSGILVHSIPVAQAKRPLAFNQDIKALIPNADRIDPDYLFWFVRSQESELLARGVKKGATVHSLQSGVIENLRVPVPNLEQQRRIVDLLSRAEGIVRLRREAQKKAAEIIPALFIDMFGDPAMNPKGWPVRRIDELCSVQTGATPKRDQRLYFEGGSIPWVKTGEVCGDAIRNAGEYITELAVRATNCKVFPVETILVAMYGQGQTRGRAGILKIPAATNQACAAILPGASIQQRFLFALIRMQYERLRAMGRGGNQANLNLGMIKSLEVPNPPMDVQRRFVAATDAVESIQAQQCLAASVAEASFRALLGRVFSQRADAQGGRDILAPVETVAVA